MSKRKRTSPFHALVAQACADDLKRLTDDAAYVQETYVRPLLSMYTLQGAQAKVSDMKRAVFEAHGCAPETVATFRLPVADMKRVKAIKNQRRSANMAITVHIPYPKAFSARLLKPLAYFRPRKTRVTLPSAAASASSSSSGASDALTSINKKLKPLRAPDVCDVILALLFACGRRTIEVLRNAVFEPVGLSIRRKQCYVHGIAKKSEFKEKRALIPLLVPYAVFAEALDYVRVNLNPKYESASYAKLRSYYQPKLRKLLNDKCDLGTPLKQRACLDDDDETKEDANNTKTNSNSSNNINHAAASSASSAAAAAASSSAAATHTVIHSRPVAAPVDGLTVELSNGDTRLKVHHLRRLYGMFAYAASNQKKYNLVDFYKRVLLHSDHNTSLTYTACTMGKSSSQKQPPSSQD